MTNERPEIWSCDLRANERPQKKLHGEGTDTQTDTQTDKHRDSMTESAQWADSVKKKGTVKMRFVKKGNRRNDGVFNNGISPY